MINLLPPAEKTRILQERKKNIVVILWFLALFFICCLSLILLSINIYLKSEAATRKAILKEAEEKFNQSEAWVFQGKINSANSELKKLEQFYEGKIYFSEILGEVSQLVPPQISLKSFSAVLCSDEAECLKIALGGFAEARDDLFEFKKVLEGKSNFKEVNFPPANWVKPTNVDFSATFKIIKEK